MRQTYEHPTAIHAEFSPEVAAWILRVAVKELERDRPRWARLDLEELTSFLMFLGDAVPARYRTKIPALPARERIHAA
jgi:hypothetical protein